MLLLNHTTSLLVPWFLKGAIDTLKGIRHLSDLTPYIWGMVISAGLQCMFRILSRFVIFEAGRNIEYDLRGDLFSHLETLPQTFFQKMEKGDLMARLTNYINGVRVALGFGILNLFNTILAYVFSLGMMFSLDPLLALCVVLPYLIIGGIIVRLGKLIFKRSLLVQQEYAHLEDWLIQRIAGIQLVKAYTQEKDQLHQLEKLSTSYLEKNMHLAISRGLVGNLMGVVGSLGTLMVLGVGTYRVITGVLSLGTFVAFNQYLGMLIWPTIALGWLMSVLQRGKASFVRIVELFEELPSRETVKN